jgi:DNA-binding transcriptional ArsR family regulator
VQTWANHGWKTAHLAVLFDAGVVSHRRNGREVRYTVDPERLQAAVQAMTDAAARWNARLRAIKRIAEVEHQKRSQ